MHALILQEKVERFVRVLLTWATNNTRDFPWRKTKDPYRILVAEIMLQRTKAEQVVPVYEQFVRKYPTIRSLSKASVAELRTEILSLGLEKRARGLKKLAVQLLEEHGGEIPRNREELIKLHWVGNYIANAILCHAFGVDVPTVDVNVARVLVRGFSLKPKLPAQKDKQIWKFAEGLMPMVKGRARELNLAFLDLASGICTSRNPACLICPLNSICSHGIGALKSRQQITRS